MSPSQKLIATCPKCKNESIYKGTAKRPRITCKECKTRFYLLTQSTQNEKKIVKKKKSKPLGVSDPPTPFIDEPNELLMDVAMKVLNRQRYELMKEGKIPSNPWGSILLQMLDKTKQLETITKSDLQSKLKQYSSTELINLRKRLIES